ncbi:sodium hydrogen exchanger family protein [Paraphaeosphaeria sporulosa]
MHSTGTEYTWKQQRSAMLNQTPDVTGIHVGRLFILGFLVMTFRRIPANFMTYNTLVPRCVKDWKDTLFIGFLGSIGKGVFVAARSKPGEATTDEEENLAAAMIPVVYWLVIFSVVFHDLLIPALDAFYCFKAYFLPSKTSLLKCACAQMLTHSPPFRTQPQSAILLSYTTDVRVLSRVRHCSVGTGL